MIGDIVHGFNQVKGLLILLLSLVMSALFLLLRDGDYVTKYPYFCNDDYFWAMGCFSDMKLTRETFLYFLFEHLILLILALFIWIEVPKHKTALLIFVLIQVVDTLDYLIVYGETWFYFRGYPIGWNILKVAFFSIAIFNEVIKRPQLERAN